MVILVIKVCGHTETISFLLGFYVIFSFKQKHYSTIFLSRNSDRHTDLVYIFYMHFLRLFLDEIRQ